MLPLQQPPTQLVPLQMQVPVPLQSGVSPLHLVTHCWPVQTSQAAWLQPSSFRQPTQTPVTVADRGREHWKSHVPSLVFSQHWPSHGRTSSTRAAGAVRLLGERDAGAAIAAAPHAAGAGADAGACAVAVRGLPAAIGFAHVIRADLAGSRIAVIVADALDAGAEPVAERGPPVHWKAHVPSLVSQ